MYVRLSYLPVNFQENFTMSFNPQYNSFIRMSKMLNISRKVFNLRGFKCLKILPRAACSGRFSQSQTIDTLQNAGKDESLKEKDGYGEKEIFLLGPADVRTPLPGNIGIPPLTLFYNDTISKLPEPAGENCEVTTSQLPEERYSNLLTQAACVVSENILSSYPVECVGYDCPQLLKKDFSSLFPSRDLTNRDLTVITLCQKTENNMSEWSEKAELERASLETSFVTIARIICAQLKLNNYWADFIQPNSGKPNFESLTSATLFETDLRYRHFGFTIEDLGCCRIILHTKWGAHMFVGAIFTNAPLQSKEVQNVLEHHKSIQTVF